MLAQVNLTTTCCQGPLLPFCFAQQKQNVTTNKEMKRKVFVLMQGMSHKKLSFKSTYFIWVCSPKEVTLGGHKKGIFKSVYSRKNDSFFIVSVRLLISQFILCYHMTQGFVIFGLKNFLILSFSYPRYYNNISLTIPWGYIIIFLPIPVNQRTLTQFHLFLFKIFS